MISSPPEDAESRKGFVHAMRSAKARVCSMEGEFGGLLEREPERLVRL